MKKKTMSLKQFQSLGGKSRSLKKIKAVRKNAALARAAKKKLEMEDCEW